ncbi:transcription factor MYC3-like [Juglans microcarpa x Juglans regia]|uniref:transcription factor MYC3-like n=1 Tax=Juglans microcarpa x Juglans regia TaxID=2249226 RepID=UPI001B7EC650|nr:transcription factor MYC3-like [Juglans microcarpa x Juglans regia]
MEEIIICSPSSSPLVPVCHETSPTIQELLQFIVQSRPEWWVYSIFWQKSTDNNGHAVLSWGDGHFRGTRNFLSKASNDHDGHKDGFSSEKLNESKGAQVLFADQDLDIDKEAMDGHDVTDSEWFYSVSFTRSFSVRDGDVLGRAYSSGAHIWLSGDQELQFHKYERVREARMHGIQTLVCVATSSGVVELGSSDSIQEDYWGLVQQLKSLFGVGDASSREELRQLGSHQGQPPIARRDLPFLDIGMFLQAQKACTLQEIKQPEVYAVFKDEGAAGLGRSSSYSGPSDSKRDFASENSENIRPKKRRRTQTNRRDCSVNNLEAERKRREKLNHRFYELRSVVPNVSKMDKASLLADAVVYINELKVKIDDLEAKLKAQSRKANISNLSGMYGMNRSITTSTVDKKRLSSSSYTATTMDVEVTIVGSEALIRVQCPDVNYPHARLMDALRDLEFQIHHASISSVKGLMLQDLVVKVPDHGSQSGEEMRIAILDRVIMRS